MRYLRRLKRPMLLGGVFLILFGIVFPGAFGLFAAPRAKAETVDRGPYIQVISPFDVYQLSYVAEFSAQVPGGNPLNPAIHFSWTPIHSLALKVDYRVDYHEQNGSEVMSGALCESDKSASGSAWKQLIKNTDWNISFSGSKVDVTVDQARSPTNSPKISKPAFFRYVAHPGTDKEFPVACRTDVIQPMYDDPAGRTIDLDLSALEQGSNKVLNATITVNGGTALTDYVRGQGLTPPASNNTPVKATVKRESTNNATVKFEVPGYIAVDTIVPLDQSYDVKAVMSKTANGTVTLTSKNGSKLGTVTTAPAANDESNCNQYLGFLPTNFGHYEPLKYFLCQEKAFLNTMVKYLVSFFDMVPFNTWNFIQDRPNLTLVWKIVLGLIDFLVVFSLIVAAFANIFRWKLDTYALKQVLPGLIIGIVLVNLSYFIDRVLIEGAAVATQMLGNLVSGYIEEPIAAQGASSFLAHQAWGLLAKSLFLPPASWGSAIEWNLISQTPGTVWGEAGVFAGYAVTTITSFLLLQTALIISLLGVIFFFVLVFLLLIRHAILIALFLMSPLAFFGLTFPPLKKFWTQWWDMFWKWLVMLPISYGIVAGAILFLYFVYGGSSANYEVDFFAYIIINAVAIWMLYQAVRFPFTYGKFFNTNAIDWWSKKGAGAAKFANEKGTYAARRGFDHAGGALAWMGTRQRGLDPRSYINASKVNSVHVGDAHKTGNKGLDKKISGVKRLANEDARSFARRINDQLRADQLKRRKDIAGHIQNNNPFRLAEAVKKGWAVKQEGVKKAEEGRVKGHWAYKKLAGGDAKEDADKSREKYRNIDDYDGLAPDINDVYKKMKDNMEKAGIGDAGVRQRLAAEFLRKMARSGDGERDGELAANPYLKGVNRKDFHNAANASSKWINMANSDRSIKIATGATNGGDAFINAFTQPTGSPAIGGLTPFGTSSSTYAPPQGGAPTASGGGGTTSAGTTYTTGGTIGGQTPLFSSAVEEEITMSLEEAFGLLLTESLKEATKQTQKKLDTHVADVLSEHPHTGIEVAEKMVAAQHAALEAAIKSQGLGTATSQKLLAKITASPHSGQPLHAKDFGISGADLQKVVAGLQQPLAQYKASVALTKQVLNSQSSSPTQIVNHATSILTRNSTASTTSNVSTVINNSAVQQQVAQTRQQAQENLRILHSGSVSQGQIADMNHFLGSQGRGSVVPLDEEQLKRQIHGLLVGTDAIKRAAHNETHVVPAVESAEPVIGEPIGAQASASPEESEQPAPSVETAEASAPAQNETPTAESSQQPTGDTTPPSGAV